MIALKSSDVWTRISDFGFPFPPYVKGSGLWVRDVGRSEAMELCLIDRDRQIRSATGERQLRELRPGRDRWTVRRAAAEDHRIADPQRDSRDDPRAE